MKAYNHIIVIVLIIILKMCSNASAQNPPSDLPLNEKMQTAIVDSVSVALNRVYVFPDVAVKMEKLMRESLKKGTYQKLTSLAEFTQQLTADMQSVSHDKHLVLRPMPARAAGVVVPDSPEEMKKRQKEEMRYTNFGFKKIEILPGNIGYIDLRMFAPAEQAGAIAIAAMNFLANSNAIIFDLRKNGGGNPSMIQLVTSYFYEEPVHLNSFYIRKTNSTNQFWTQAFVTGPKMVHMPLYILTSAYTFSGAEEFTYNLKNLKRATVIGETTGGGAHPVEMHIFNSLNVTLSLPFGCAVNPITNSNWEGTGVEPDIKVRADQALLVARLEALKAMQEKEKDELKILQLAWAIEGLEAERNPVNLDDSTMQNYTGVYGPRTISLKDGTLYYQRQGRPAMKLVPVGQDRFMIDGMEDFRLQMNRDSAGVCSELVGHYANGTTDVSKRTDTLHQN